MGPVTWDALWGFNLHSPGIITLYVRPRTRVQQETPSHWEWRMESQGAFVYSQTRRYVTDLDKLGKQATLDSR